MLAEALMLIKAIFCEPSTQPSLPATNPKHLRFAYARYAGQQA
jgi:hypothetical protein